jgi:hypothetical protein
VPTNGSLYLPLDKVDVKSMMDILRMRFERLLELRGCLVPLEVILNPITSDVWMLIRSIKHN